MRLLDLNGPSAAARPQRFTALGPAPTAAGRPALVGRRRSERAGEEPDRLLNTRAVTDNDCLDRGGSADVAGRVVLQALRSDPNCKSKRVVDFVLALIGIILLLPLFIVVAVAVKFETPGPVLFRQSRGGQNGRCFRILKFRTMNCMEDGVEVCQARSEDPRITRVGRFLRRTSFDELPQLFNVVRGDMSLVGPRPHALVHDAMYSELIPAYSSRQAVKPGITGWAQVNGCRGETCGIAAMERRIQHDLEYIRQWSLWLDIVIIARTVVEILRSRNAY
ncbi:exopolysaccharide biosynthesis polyprenyl glycosylphosphotransferase [Bradyrhizobium sp. CB1650]|uniref:exopolysaccharide biosynthesis polyprenyl glycosylphosphotransferase n=1 Tax=Bradyrhizobium sp. CB1650 TaxID=3039153 RepID=UPI002435DF7B|nr:exopolysaccharide biosynthesis polyprenyl glycosylphosphotransferase [Bradyrhizobium sp. CB1650]WGD54945.1 exopolysaccharide biosynthesis polyprenyl glycosylphosphotransferase [Bradyrhizobium sp. CB1650]